MINFELLNKSLKKVDQQNLSHADQESAPWAGENEDGVLRQNFLRCATCRNVEKLLPSCYAPVRDPRSLTNQALGQIKMWTSLNTSSVLAKFEDVEFCQKSFLFTFSKSWMINFELLKSRSRKSTSNT